jgi:Secretion system C-terminal sorting domain
MRKLLLLSSLLFIVINASGQLRWHKLLNDTLNNGGNNWGYNLFIKDSSIIGLTQVKYFFRYSSFSNVNGEEGNKGPYFKSRDSLNDLAPFYLYSFFDIGQISKNKKTIYYPYTSKNHPIDSSNLLTFFAKINSSTFELDTLIEFGYKKHTTLVSSLLEVEPNKIAIAATLRYRWGLDSGSRMAIYFLDSNGSTLFKDVFPTQNVEVCQNMLADRSGNFYLCGGYNPPYMQSNGDDLQNCVKKIDSKGQLLVNRILPKRNNVDYPFIVSLANNSIDKFLLINAADRYYSTVSSGSAGRNWLRFVQLDTNLNTLKTDSLKRGYFFNLQGAKTLINGDVLLWGGRSNDTLDHFYWWDNSLAAWALRLDSTGKIKWDRFYRLHDSADHYVSDMKEDIDGSLNFIGYVLGNTSNVPARNWPSKTLLMKLDSNGCINNNCYPMGVQEVKVIDDNVLLVYPNPTNSRITLRLADLDLLGGSITITSFNGARLFDGKALLAETSIDISGWAKGIYVLSYRKDDWRKNVQFVIE